MDAQILYGKGFWDGVATLLSPCPTLGSRDISCVQFMENLYYEQAHVCGVASGLEFGGEGRARDSPV